MLDRIFTPDKIRHLCTCRSDRDLTISLFTRPSPIKNMRPATCETRIYTKDIGISRARRLELFFNCRLIALEILLKQHLLWGCIAPTLHGLRGYGWLKLYREWWDGRGAHRCFSKGPPLVRQRIHCCACKRLKRIVIHEIRRDPTIT